YGGAYIFKNKMTDETYAIKISEFIAKKYNRVIIFNDRQTRNKNLADLFYGQAVDRNLTIVAQKSFSEDEFDFRDILSNLKKEKFDIVFLVSNEFSAANLLMQMREMKINVPVVGTKELDTRNFWSLAGKQAEGTIIPTHFDPKFPRKLTQNFVKNFGGQFGLEPDSFAASGYDMICLLAHAMEAGNSTIPRVIDTTLKFLESWDGALSQYLLTRNGNINPVNLFFKIYDKGGFIYPNRKVEKKDDRFEMVDEITLKLAIDKEIQTIDPGQANDNISTEISKQLFLRLIQYKSPDYSPMPDMALSWKSNEDSSIYTFKLRKNVFWTNNEPVTAHDIVGTLRKNISPENKNPNVRHLFIIKNAQKIHNGQIKDVSSLGVTAIDNLTVRFNLTRPASYFPILTGLPIYSTLPIKTIKTFGDKWTLPENIQTNGPYKPVHYNKGILLILRKNSKYYDSPEVAIQEVRYQIIPNSYIGLSMYQKNSLDILGGPFQHIPSNAMETIMTSPKTRSSYYQKMNFKTYVLTFNLNKTPIENILIRKAITSVINKHFIASFVTNGRQEANFLVPKELHQSENNFAMPFNSNHAKTMIAEAGFFNGVGIPLIRIATKSTKIHRDISEAVALMLKKYLNIKTQVIDINDTNQDAHIYCMDFNADIPDPHSIITQWYQSTKQNTHYTNTKIERLLDKAALENKYTIRKKYYLDIEKILLSEKNIIIPICYETLHYLVNPRVGKWFHMPVGGQSIKLWELR
ncbi:peptide ABC transporter substrate-binding protein, partial [Candidatus Magnetomorum sp. HK-1]